MIAPAYHDIQADQIPSVPLKNGEVKVISGQYHSTVGPGRPHTGVLYLDDHLNKKGDISIPIKNGWNGFIYVYEGKVSANIDVAKGTLAVVETDGSFECESKTHDTKFILVAGDPIGEPVARGGPFVMNTKAEVMQAFEDYNSGKLS